MVETADDFNETLALLRKYCSNNTLHLLYHMDCGDVVIRSDITETSEAFLFVEAYEAITHSRFRLYNSRLRLKRMYWKKDWVCRDNFSAGSSVGKCAARISIGIKKVTKASKANDGFLKLVPPLQAVIKITTHHNHILTVPSPTKPLKVSREVRENFYEYFRNGIKGVKAKRLHEENLIKANITTNLDDATINPLMSTIYALYRKWKQLKVNVHLNKVPVSNYGPAFLATVHEGPLLPFSTGGSNVQKIEPSLGTGLNHGGDNPNFKLPVKIKEEVMDDEEEDSQLPIIVSCRSLAPEANNTVVSYQTHNALPSSSSNSSVMPAQNNQPVPLVANNVPIQNSTVVPTNSGVSFLRVEPVNNRQLVVFNKSNNTYKVVQYLKICSTTSATVNSSNQYSSYFPNRIQLPTRVGIHKL